jgi:hypothetical protein
MIRLDKLYRMRDKNHKCHVNSSTPQIKIKGDEIENSTTT